MMVFVLLPLTVFLKELPVPQENPLLVLLFSENCIPEGQFFSCAFCQFFSVWLTAISWSLMKVTFYLGIFNLYLSLSETSRVALLHRNLSKKTPQTPGDSGICWLLSVLLCCSSFAVKVPCYCQVKKQQPYPTDFFWFRVQYKHSSLIVFVNFSFFIPLQRVILRDRYHFL